MYLGEIELLALESHIQLSYTDRKKINKWHCSDLVYIDEIYLLKCSSSILTKLYGLMKPAAFLAAWISVSNPISGGSIDLACLVGRFLHVNLLFLYLIILFFLHVCTCH